MPSNTSGRGLMPYGGLGFRVGGEWLRYCVFDEEPAFLAKQFFDLAEEDGPGRRPRGVVEDLGAGLSGPHRDIEPLVVAKADQVGAAKLGLGPMAGPQ